MAVPSGVPVLFMQVNAAVGGDIIPDGVNQFFLTAAGFYRVSYTVRGTSGLPADTFALVLDGLTIPGTSTRADGLSHASVLFQAGTAGTSSLRLVYQGTGLYLTDAMEAPKILIERIQ